MCVYACVCFQRCRYTVPACILGLYTCMHIHSMHPHAPPCMRMPRCLATLGLSVRGIKVEDPSCVRKTVPSFFQILAAPPPRGLGAEVYECDPASGTRVRRLCEPADLFAVAPPKAK